MIDFERLVYHQYLVRLSDKLLGASLFDKAVNHILVLLQVNPHILTQQHLKPTLI